MNALANVTTPTGYFCPTPVVFEWQGEGMSRPCGHCARCFAVKKRDLTGRAAAEAVMSEEMVTFTLTYRPGETGAFKWCIEDRQNFMKRLRKRLWDNARKFVGAPVRYQRKFDSDGVPWKTRIGMAQTTARYFGCGETGERGTKRHHWHVVVFFKHGPAGPSGFVTSKRDVKGRLIGEDNDIWPHGISTIDVHSAHMVFRMSAVRYVSKYITKAALAFKQKKAGREPDALLFRSLKPALGAEYLGQWAERHAEAALPLPGEYTVPHVTFSRGRRDSVRHRLLGVSRGYVINRYRDAWVRLRPGADVPHSDFLARYDDLYVMRSTGRRRPLGVVRSAALSPIPPAPTHCAGNLVVWVGAKVRGVVQTLRTGVAIWQPVGSPMAILDPPSLRGVVPELDDQTQDKIEAFIQDRRGPDWQSPRERFEAGQDRHCARLQALIDGLPVGDMLEMGTHSKRALTCVGRKLRLAGQVSADMKPIRAVYKPPSNLERYIKRDWESVFDEKPREKPPLQWQRPPAETGLHWPNMPLTLRKVP